MRAKSLLLPILVTLLMMTLPVSCAKPVTPEPAKFEVSGLSTSPFIVMPSDPVTVTATIDNTGGTEGTYTAILTLDGKEIGKETALIGPEATKTVTFKLTSPETPGSYTLSVGEASANLRVSPWVAYTCQYDYGIANKFWTNSAGKGFLSQFEIPSNSFRIKGINIYGVIGVYGKYGYLDVGSLQQVDLEKRSFTLRIWDKKLSQQLYSQSYPYNLFPYDLTYSTSFPAWVEVQVPDLMVNDDFYVEVVPNAEMMPNENKTKCGLSIGLDLSAAKGNANTIQNGVVQPWGTTFGAKETAAWMVRVEGWRGPRVEQYLLSYDDGMAEGSYWTSKKSYLVRFSPPSPPFSITQVLIYGYIKADSPTDYQNREFSVKVYNKAGKKLWNQNFPWQLFKEGTAKWVEVGVPNVAVDDDFYVEVTTNSISETRIQIDYDGSTPNKHSDMSLNGKIIPWEPWTYKEVERTRDKVNWMFRVKGTALID